jgi:uncharacterized membrane protein
MAATERFDLDLSPQRAWLATFTVAVLTLAAGAVALPRLVWDRFLWHYFWGPIFADAQGARCAVMTDTGPELLFGEARCSAARNAGSIVAEPGYTLVSEAGYAVTLIFFLVGVLYLLRALEVGETLDLFFALTPFMFFGGALRVVEDANDAVPAAEALISYPLNTLVISPVIYFTVFFVTLAAVVATVYADRSGALDDYARPLAGIGGALVALCVGYLLVLALMDVQNVAFYPQVTVVVLLGATAAASATWWLIENYEPEINAGTGRIGYVVIWGHAVDGVANVVGLDFMPLLGAGRNLIPKHPVNRAIVEVTGSALPESVLAVTGDAWPFLLVKLVAATAVVWLFDDEVFEESPRYTLLMLVAIVAVGLGPGTRDMLRATFGV